MSGHEHEWRPLYREVGCYDCDCGAAGRRQLDGSIIESMTSALDPDELITARPTTDRSIDAHGRRLALITDDSVARL